MIRRWIDAIRRNHALEHATVAVLLARHGPMRLVGRAGPDGFFILGDVDNDELTATAREALAMLQGGRAGLAVSPMCGTNIAVSAALAALGASAVLATGPVRSRLPNAFVVAMFGVIGGQPLGRIVQQRFTTLVDHAGVEVVGTRTLFGRIHKIETRSSS